jgi:hypothetical protein
MRIDFFERVLSIGISRDRIPYTRVVGDEFVEEVPWSAWFLFIGIWWIKRDAVYRWCAYARTRDPGPDYRELGVRVPRCRFMNHTPYGRARQT